MSHVLLINGKLITKREILCVVCIACSHMHRLTHFVQGAKSYTLKCTYRNFRALYIYVYPTRDRRCNSADNSHLQLPL